MSGIAGIIGAVGAVGNLIGGGGRTSGNTSGGTSPVGYVPTAQGTADAGYQDIFSRLYGAGSGEAGATLPFARQISGDLLNNPYSNYMVDTANDAARYSVDTLAPMYQQGGAALNESGRGALPYASRILESGFDPQNALYDRELGRLRDAAGVSAARYGITGPYAAGVENQAVNNFNLDWGDRQLGRQNQAITGYGNAVNSAGRAIGGGADIAGQSVPAMTAGGALPYSTYRTPLTNQLGDLGNIVNYSNMQYGLPLQTANLLQSYMGLGQTANANATNAALSQYYQNQQTGNQLGASLGAITNAFGPASSWFTGSGGLPGASYVPPSNYSYENGGTDLSMYGF